ncbi:MAG TPA: DUF1549 domain-containing protein, partial [Isosphaeraceae bacterium]|nr:DUF1549 domain-containing protein [Isosphaeraceae bacterium]
MAIAASPADIHLRGAGARWRILVDGNIGGDRLVDLSRAARFRSLAPSVATVSEQGWVEAMADGQANIEVEAAGQSCTVPVCVEATSETRKFHFENDVVPLLSRLGCNASGCHGKAEGQNGFKLSVFGFDPQADFAALVDEGRGRRVFPAAPEQSLLLLKMTGAVPHGGGVRCAAGSREYELFRGWIAAGTPKGESSAPTVASIQVQPHERLLAVGATQQLRVIARDTANREFDVTALARFQSNNEALGTVDDCGLVTVGQVPGEVAVMATYMGCVDVFQALVPRSEAIANRCPWPDDNRIDALVARKLRKLNIQPSEPADDAEYLRRVYLGVIGTLPTPEEARHFLRDPRPDRRARLVDRLLSRPEFNDYWALQWADLLRVDRDALGHKRAYAYYRWIRESIAQHKPLDQFARELVTAEGPLDAVGPASFYKVVSRPGDVASTFGQVFMGVRIACAECHHHPFDRWGQDDYYGMAAFFAPVGLRPSPRGEELLALGDPATRNPRSGQVVPAHALAAEGAGAASASERRQALAEWLTSPENPWFARNLANRVWAHLMGRGLVEPVDDVRSTNPPSNPELLDELARTLVASKFDLRALICEITQTRVYSLSAQPNSTNVRDEQNYSRASFKRIEAEVLLDMVCQTTGVGEKFPGVPAGSRAIQLWDSKVPHYFLKLFGRPVRATACEC